MSNNGHDNRKSGRLVELTDEDKIAIAVRFLGGEPSSHLAREFHTTPAVIESWAERVGELMDSAVDSEEGEQVAAKLGKLKQEYKRLLLQLDEAASHVKLRETELRMRSQKPGFMVEQ